MEKKGKKLLENERNKQNNKINKKNRLFSVLCFLKHFFLPINEKIDFEFE